MRHLFICLSLFYTIAHAAIDDEAHEISKAANYGILSMQTTPRVAIMGQTTTVKFEFIMNPGSFSGTPVLVLKNGTRLSTYDNASNGDLTANDNKYSVDVPLVSITSTKPADTAYKVDVGTLEVNEAGSLSRYNIFLMVMDESIPTVAIKNLSASAQQAGHVLNIAAPDILQYVLSTKATNGGNATEQLSSRVFTVLPKDQYDFLYATYDRTHFDNSFYQVINRNIGGIGANNINFSSYGAGTRLNGLLMIGAPTRYDGLDTQFTHEIGHHWMSHLTLNTQLSNGRSHWPPSTMGAGVMGVSIPGSGAGGTYFCEGLWNAAGNAVTLRGTNVSEGKYTFFNPLDLYLMGLAPASEVPDQILYDSTDMQACKPGTYTSGYTRLRVQDVINAHGPRNPAYGIAPTNFKVASVVLSSQLLTAREMAYFDFMARRASWRMSALSKTGLSQEIGRPFYLATGGRGSVDTVMDASLVNHEVLTVTEFYNAALKRYFYTADPAETNYLKTTPASGEAATGGAFKVYGLVNAPPEALPVCRFYGSLNPGPNSHFYTASSTECDGLKAQQATTPATQKRWNFEGLAYRVKLPQGNACPVGQTPVYRVYNNAHLTAGKDSNHRFTTSLATAQAMAGYTVEGVVMCVD